MSVYCVENLSKENSCRCIWNFTRSCKEIMA